jgi:hypothetical protein
MPSSRFHVNYSILIEKENGSSVGLGKGLIHGYQYRSNLS